jgi:hypothetical protein
MNGIDMYFFLIAYGPIPKPPRVLKAQEDFWQNMTLDSLKIEYTQKGYLLRIECVLEQARVLNKNGLQIKQKLIDGLPAFFNTEKSAMRHDNTYVFPPLLGGLPEYAMTTQAANVHPMAGQQDGESLLLAYIPDFISKASETRSLPRGLVRMIHDTPADQGNLDDIDDGTDSQHGGAAKAKANLLAKDVTDSTVCNCCGGSKHATVQIASDGTKIICAKKQLEDMGILSKPATDLAKDTRYKSRARKYQQQNRSLTEQNKMLMQTIEQLTEDHDKDQSDTDSQISAASLGQTCDDDSDDSAESDASNLSSFDASSFANKIQSRKKPAMLKGRPIRKPKHP